MGVRHEEKNSWVFKLGYFKLYKKTLSLS
jgi:hypothetical protein